MTKQFSSGDVHHFSNASPWCAIGMLNKFCSNATLPRSAMKSIPTAGLVFDANSQRGQVQRDNTKRALTPAPTVPVISRSLHNTLRSRGRRPRDRVKHVGGQGSVGPGHFVIDCPKHVRDLDSNNVDPGKLSSSSSLRMRV